MKTVITANEARLKSLCMELGRKVVISNLKPDIIIGIKSGGAVVSNYICQLPEFIECVHEVVKLQRASTLRKEKMNIKKFISKMPYVVTNFLRLIESGILEYKHNRMNDADSDVRIEISPEILRKIKMASHLLIIDDAVDSGRTMKTIKDYIQSLNRNLNIKTAALTVTFQKPLIIPDFYLFKNTLIRFPWSFDYAKEIKHG